MSHHIEVLPHGDDVDADDEVLGARSSSPRVSVPRATRVATNAGAGSAGAGGAGGASRSRVPFDAEKLMEEHNVPSPKLDNARSRIFGDSQKKQEEATGNNTIIIIVMIIVIVILLCIVVYLVLQRSKPATGLRNAVKHDDLGSGDRAHAHTRDASHSRDPQRGDSREGLPRGDSREGLSTRGDAPRHVQFEHDRHDSSARSEPKPDTKPSEPRAETRNAESRGADTRLRRAKKPSNTAEDIEEALALLQAGSKAEPTPPKSDVETTPVDPADAKLQQSLQAALDAI